MDETGLVYESIGSFKVSFLMNKPPRGKSED